MAATVRYLTTRNGVFQYERWVPEAYQSALGRKLFRKSLRTRSQRDALAAAEIAEREFSELIATAGGPKPSPLIHTPGLLRQLTNTDLDLIEVKVRQRGMALWQQLYLRSDSDPSAAAQLEHIVHELEIGAEERQMALAQPGFHDERRPDLPSPTAEAAGFADTLALNAPPGSDEFGLIVAAVRRGHHARHRDLDELLDGKARPRTSDPSPSSKTSITIETAVSRYLEHKNLPPKTVTEVKLAMRTFVAIIGDKPLPELTQADFKGYVEQLGNGIVGGKSKGSIQRPIAAGTVKKRLGFLCTAINFAIERGWFEGRNQASGIKIDDWVQRRDAAVMPSKRPFKVGELNLLFQHPWFAGCKSPRATYEPGVHRLDSAEFWAPVTALFTGCRAAELGGLRIAEIMIDDPHPHIAIRDNEYRRTKGAYARDVPILDALFDLGFRAYVERVKRTGADRLFPTWESPKRSGGFDKDDAAWSNAKLLRAFNRTVIPAALGKTMVEGARRTVTFHSFRGAFKSMLGRAEYGLHPNIINEVVGHAKPELDRRYVGTIPIEETYGAVRGCTYPGLIKLIAPAT